MNKKLFLLAILVLSSGILMAQTNKIQATLTPDPLDVSKLKENVEKYGIPTINSVEVLKAKADSLYTAKLWKDAANAYQVYIEKVNWLANLLSECVEPYYSADYDDRKSLSYATIQKILPFESKANECKRNRNNAYLKMALCYKNLGDIKQAVVYLNQALELISINDSDDWAIARNTLAEILQYAPQN